MLNYGPYSRPARAGESAGSRRPGPARSRIMNETGGSIEAHTPLAPRSAAYDASVTVLPCAHADFISLGVCQDPECSRMVVADEPTAGREGGFDSGNGIVVRNSQIKMNSVALRARFVHLLEPERRTAIGRVD
jgi:hypothetical protein